MVWLKTFFKLCHCIWQFSLWVITFINRIQLSKLSATMNRIMQYMKKKQKKKLSAVISFQYKPHCTLSICCMLLFSNSTGWLNARKTFLSDRSSTVLSHVFLIKWAGHTGHSLASKNRPTTREQNAVVSRHVLKSLTTFSSLKSPAHGTIH